MLKQSKEKPIAKKKLIDLVDRRLFAYSFLKRVFIEEATKEFLELLITENLLEIFIAKEENKQIKQGIETIYLYLKNPGVLSDENITELSSDYVNLFIGPGKLVAAPYESVYLSEKRLVFQEQTIEVRRAYYKHNLVPEKLQSEPDDHIALELDFMGLLCKEIGKDLRANKLTAARKKLNTQKKFMKEHLMLWALEFSENVQKGAREDFYMGAAQMLTGLLTVDQDMIKESLRQLKLRIDQDKEKNKKHKLKSVKN
ncbi:MAG TPA: dehydrogenase [Actinobacteria bacterium]|nr:dehydrogenase [Actinomycetota bacterium]